MVRGTYYGQRAEEAEIDKLSGNEAKERCKLLLKANKGLLGERGELPLGRHCRSAMASPQREIEELD